MPLHLKSTDRSPEAVQKAIEVVEILRNAGHDVYSFYQDPALMNERAQETHKRRIFSADIVIEVVE